MKKVIVGLALCLSLGMYACGGSKDGGNALDPTKVDFDSPSGTLSEDNADDVGSESVKTFGSKDIDTPQALQSLTNAIINGLGEGCFSNFTETGGTVDWGCYYENVPGCTGSGTVEYKISNNNNLFTYTYKNAETTCDGSLTTKFNGKSSWALDTAVYCNDLTITYGSDYTYKSKGCFNALGQAYIVVNGESYVVNGFAPSCSGFSITVTDSASTTTMTCDAETEGDTCDSTTDITGATNCTISTSGNE